MPEPRFPYVLVDVPEVEAEEAGAVLFELGALGLEQRDDTTLTRGARGRVTLVASFERQEDARVAAAELPEGWAPRVEEVVGDAWRDEWKKHFEPFAVCPGIVVRPPWRDAGATPGVRSIVLEPGRAFGTGLHETTGLVAEVLAGEPLDGKTVLDVGCGSGILSLVAVALGARRARALDVDPDAVAVTRENAERNGWADRIEADAAQVATLEEAYPVVVANIEAKTLVDLAPGLLARTEPGGLLVLSGILAPDIAPAQVVDVRRAFAGVREDSLRRRGEWVAIVARR
jgi:ribosomal protein L11 methyltransferase